MKTKRDLVLELAEERSVYAIARILGISERQVIRLAMVPSEWKPKPRKPKPNRSKK